MPFCGIRVWSDVGLEGRLAIERMWLCQPVMDINKIWPGKLLWLTVVDMHRVPARS